MFTRARRLLDDECKRLEAALRRDLQRVLDARLPIWGDWIWNCCLRPAGDWERGKTFRRFVDSSALPVGEMEAIGQVIRSDKSNQTITFKLLTGLENPVLESLKNDKGEITLPAACCECRVGPVPGGQ